MKRLIALLVLCTACTRTATSPNDGGVNGAGQTPIAQLKWSSVDGNGTAGLSITTIPPQVPTFPNAVVFNSKLYTSFTESQVCHVKVYNGNDAAPMWTAIDAKGFNCLGPTYLAVFNSKLYLTFASFNGKGVGSLRVFVYNGNDTAPAWTAVDGNGITVGMFTSARKQIFVFNNKLYVAFVKNELIAGLNVNNLHLLAYNGNDAAPAWTDVGGAGGVTRFGSGGALGTVSGFSFSVFNGKLYAVWSNVTLSGSVYNGNDSSPAWSSVGSISSGPGEGSELAVFNNSLYVIYYEYAETQPERPIYMKLKIYGGNDQSPAWNSVDNSVTGLNQNDGDFVGAPHMAVAGSALYATWAEAPLSNGVLQIRVAGIAGASSWNPVDGGGTSGINRDTTALALCPFPVAFNGKLYELWSETNTDVTHNYATRAFMGQ